MGVKHEDYAEKIIDILEKHLPFVPHYIITRAAIEIEMMMHKQLQKAEYAENNKGFEG